MTLRRYRTGRSARLFRRLPSLAALRGKPSLATLLGVLVAAALLPTAGIGIWFLDRSVDERRGEHLRKLQEMATTISHAVDRELRGWRETVEVVAMSPLLTSGDIMGFHEWARAAAPRAGGVIILVDRDGRMLVNTRSEPRDRLPSPNDGPTYARALSSGKTVVGDMFTGAVGGQLTFVVATPVIRDGEARYALAISPGIQQLQALVAEHALASGWLAAIIDGNGRLLARSRRAEEFLGRQATPEFLARMSEPMGIVESVDFEGRVSTTAYYRSAASGWRTVVWAPKALLDAPSRAAAQWGALLLVSTLLVSGASAWLASLLIRRPVGMTLAAASQLARGEPVRVESTAMAEAERIATALADASKAIEARRRALAESEARIRHIANATPAMLWTAAPDGHIWASERWYEYTGIEPGSITRGFASVMHTDDRLRCRELWRQAVASGTEITSEARLRRKDGVWRWFQTHAVPHRDEAGRIIAWYGSTSDIDDLKRTERELAQSEERLRLAQDIAGIGTVEWEMATDRLHWSRTIADITGLPPAGSPEAAALEVEGRRTLLGLLGRVPLEDAHALETGHRHVLDKGGTFTVELPFRSEGGELGWVHLRGEVFPGADASPGRVIAVARDITRRKRNEIDTARFTTVADASGEAIIGTDRSGRIEVWNRGAERLYGWSAEEVRGLSVAILAPPGRPREVLDLVERAMEGKAIGPIDVTRLRRDGSPVEVNISIGPVRDAAGRVVAVSLSAHDITERKRQEAQTRFVMRELSHRTKNLLAVVQAMARQTARLSRDLDDFQSRFAERVAALARSHDLLVAQEWHGAPLAELVASQLMPFVGRDRDRLSVSGPPVLLRPEAAQNLGLALHELATNAAKHGALSTALGRVEVGWSLVPAADDGMARFELTWQERGGPPVATSDRRGFGREVIERLVPSALGGEATFASEPSGVVWRLEAPADVVTGDTLPGTAADFDIGTRSRELRELYRVWSSARGRERLPRYAAVAGGASATHASAFTLACSAGRSPRLSLVGMGSDLASRIGLGSETDGSSNPALRALLVAAGRCLARIEATASPCYDTVDLETDAAGRLAFEVLLAPFSEDGATISHLVGMAFAR